MNSYNVVSKWISEDLFRAECLDMPGSLISGEWFISAGFVRNLVWDKLHGYEQSTQLNDIDVIYYNASDTSRNSDIEIENNLKSMMPICNWSVKNQARMSKKHGHGLYDGCIDAMSYWPEVQTAIGVTKLPDGKLQIISPFNPSEVLQLVVTRNPICTSNVFFERLEKKKWLKLWPKLRIVA